MDSSPNSSKKSKNTDSPSSNLVEVQESPIFTYISNLSTIKPVKEAPTPQGFPGLNSPPFIFTSPRINSSSNSASLERPHLSGSRLSGKDENPKEDVRVADESGISNAQSSSYLIPCPQNGHVNDNSLPENASRLQGSADDFVTNGMNSDGTAFTTSGDIPQSVNNLVHSTASEVKLKGKDEMAYGASSFSKDKDDKGKNEMETIASPLISQQAEEVHQDKPSSDLKPAEADEKLEAGCAPSKPCPAFEPKLPIDCAFNQHSVYSKAEDAGIGKEAELGHMSQFGCQQNVEEQGKFGEHTDVQCTEEGQNKMQQDHILKVGLQQRGVRRRCLQFEDAQRKTIEKCISAQNLSGTSGFPSSSSSPEVLEVLETSSPHKPAILGTGLLAGGNKPSFSPQHSGNYTMKVPKPSGIGLHLNSIVNAMQMDSSAIVSLKSAERSSLSILGKTSSSTMSSHLSKNSANKAEVVSVSSEDSKHDNVASITTPSTTSLSEMVKHMSDCLLFKPIELQPYQCDNRKSSSENADRIDDSSSSSPKKKRKKTIDTGDSNGCKRCNCKKTKCFKLYCDCFAAGIYCADPCACQGCFNRPEYEDIVLETRQQIESRNPLAFAPKIIQHMTVPSASSYWDDGTRCTPASARHKRGCNCKKSKCLKKYCECYQFGVGCCDGCRCEGCKNMYGRKEEYSMIKNVISKHENNAILDGSYGKLELLASRDSLLHNEQCTPQNLTPVKPSFQCSNHGKAASKTWFSSGRCLSPESGLNFLASYGMSPGLATNHDNHGMIPETNNEIMDLVSFDHELEYGSGDSMNHFRPGFDGPRDPGYLPCPPNPQNSSNILTTEMVPGNRHVSPASSLRWRSSPISPMTQFGRTKLLEVANFDGRLYGMLNDDTPEILKETPTLRAVKVSSPNRKRVSPHGHGNAIGSSSSAGLRSGRKFILQAVPSFPPLTPCVDSKVQAGEHMNDSQDCSRRR